MKLIWCGIGPGATSLCASPQRINVPLCHVVRIGEGRALSMPSMWPACMSSLLPKPPWCVMLSLGTIVLSALGGVETDANIHTPGMGIDGLYEPSPHLMYPTPLYFCAVTAAFLSNTQHWTPVQSHSHCVRGRAPGVVHESACVAGVGTEDILDLCGCWKVKPSPGPAWLTPGSPIHMFFQIHFDYDQYTSQHTITYEPLVRTTQA